MISNHRITKKKSLRDMTDPLLEKPLFDRNNRNTINDIEKGLVVDKSKNYITISADEQRKTTEGIVLYPGFLIDAYAIYTSTSTLYRSVGNSLSLSRH